MVDMFTVWLSIYPHHTEAIAGRPNEHTANSTKMIQQLPIAPCEEVQSTPRAKVQSRNRSKAKSIPSQKHQLIKREKPQRGLVIFKYNKAGGAEV